MLDEPHRLHRQTSKRIQSNGKDGHLPRSRYGKRIEKVYGVQFHPEVMHTQYGMQMLRNFLYEVCGAVGDWTMGNFAARQIAALKEKIGDKKVLCALSGGVDSAVAATLIHKACPGLICVSWITVYCVKTKRKK